jgi:hypothetical protein
MAIPSLLARMRQYSQLPCARSGPLTTQAFEDAGYPGHHLRTTAVSTVAEPQV